MESCVVHHFSSVYPVIARYGDISQQAFIGQAIKVWEVHEAFRRSTKNTWWPIPTWRTPKSTWWQTKLWSPKVALGLLSEDAV